MSAHPPISEPGERDPILDYQRAGAIPHDIPGRHWAWRTAGKGKPAPTYWGGGDQMTCNGQALEDGDA